MTQWNMSQQQIDQACLESNKLGKLIFNLKEKPEDISTVKHHETSEIWEVLALTAIIIAFLSSLFLIGKK